MAAVTAERMARGGMYDQLAGGFARYSVDARWVVPHFEKMLYDNALLLRVYAHLARLTGAALPRRVADETAAFLLRDLRTAGGRVRLGAGRRHRRRRGPHLRLDPAPAARGARRRRRRVGRRPAGGDRRRARSSTAPPPCSCPPTRTTRPAGPGSGRRCWRPGARPQPASDDKVITAWNGMAVLALAEGGAALGPPGVGRRRGGGRRAAAGAAHGGRAAAPVVARRRGRRRGRRAGGPRCLADALLALHQATGSARWLTAATGLLDLALDHFADPPDGSFYDTADDAEALLHRPRELTDNATPCGALGADLGAAHRVGAGGRAGPLPGRGRGGAARGRHAGGAAPAVRRPLAHRGRGPGPRTAAGRRRRCRTATGSRCSPTPASVAPGGTVVVAGAPDAPGVPLLADRPLVDGGPAAYVCRGFVCDRPVTTAAELDRSSSPG